MLVHNAMTPFAITSFAELSWEQLGGMLDSELRAAFLTTKAVVPGMVSRGYGIGFKDDNPTRTLKAGDTFYEPTGCLHRVSRNPSKEGKTRILAVVLHPADVKDIVIPETD